MRKIRLRTKFLLSLLAISTGLTAATLLIVSYSVQKRLRESIRDELRNSATTYRSFEKQRADTLARSASLLANLPNVRALMTTEDAATIQDASADVWKLSGSDLLVLANRTGKRGGALRADNAGSRTRTAQRLLRRTLDRGESRDWWFDGRHLYEVWIQPIYFGGPSKNTTLGLLALGYVVDEREPRKNSARLPSSEVAFQLWRYACCQHAERRPARRSGPADSRARENTFGRDARNSDWRRTISRSHRKSIAGQRPLGIADHFEIAR